MKSAHVTTYLLGGPLKHVVKSYPTWLLAPYEILATIGAGGMGEVYSAKDTRLGRTVAIKILNREHMQGFEREARAIAASAANMFARAQNC